MANVNLDIAFWEYDRTRALSDGAVKVEGVDAKYHSAPIVTEIFRSMIAGHSFDVSELGLTYFLRTFKGGESPFVAIPVFPNRAFRHSAIFVNTKRGIERPEDLNGRTIGELALYSHDAGVVPKGILMEEFGFKPETCRWVIGGLDWPLRPIDFVPHTHPANVLVSNIPNGKELGAMLDAGEIDALISADVPKCMLEHSSNVRRLFPDYESVERLPQSYGNLPDNAHSGNSSRFPGQASWNRGGGLQGLLRCKKGSGRQIPSRPHFQQHGHNVSLVQSAD